MKESYGFYLLLKKHWEKPSTIIVVLCALLGSGLWFFSGIDLESFGDRISPLEVGLLCVVVSAVWGTWYYSRRPHVTQTGKIGIAIAIDSRVSRRKEQGLNWILLRPYEIKLDLGINSITMYLNFQTITQERFLTRSRRVNIKESRRRIWSCMGNVGMRTHEGKPTYVLDLHAGVSHLPVPPEVGALLKHDMGQVFPSKALIPETDEVMGFQVTQDIVQHAARYTLGTASLLSHDAITAFDLHRGLWDETISLSESDSNVFPGYKLIKNKLPPAIGYGRSFIS